MTIIDGLEIEEQVEIISDAKWIKILTGVVFVLGSLLLSIVAWYAASFDLRMQNIEETLHSRTREYDRRITVVETSVAHHDHLLLSRAKK